MWKFVLAKILGNPYVMYPMTCGLSAMLVGWAFLGNPLVWFLGLISTLAGFGMLASNLTVGLSDLTENLYEEHNKLKIEERHARIKAIIIKLDRSDAKAAAVMRDIKDKYKKFRQTLEMNRKYAAQFEEKIEQLVDISLVQAEEYHINRQKKFFKELVDSSNLFSSILSELTEIKIKQISSVEVRRDLETTLEVHKRVSENLEEFERNDNV